MADAKISALTALTGATVDSAADVLPIVDTSVTTTKKITVAQLLIGMGILPSTSGGTGNGFTKFTGPTTSEKTFTLPNASSTLLASGGALGTPSSGTLTSCTGLPAAGVVGTAAILGANTFTGDQTLSSASFIISGNISAAAWTTNGVRIKGTPGMLTDTSSSGTVAAAYTDVLGGNTIAASSATTFSDYFTQFIKDPVAGSNVTLTRKFSLGTEGWIKQGSSNGAAQGWIFGSLTSGYSMIWTTGVTPSAANYMIASGSGSALYINADASSLNFKIGGTVQAQVLPTSLKLLYPTTSLIFEGLNTQRCSISVLTELLTIAAAATSTTTIQKPANSIVLGVSVRVTTAVTCTSTFTVGDSGSAARFSTAAVSKALNSTDPGTKAGAYYNATAEGIVITPDTTPSDATGRVRVTIYYFDVTPPTS